MLQKAIPNIIIQDNYEYSSIVDLDKQIIEVVEIDNLKVANGKIFLRKEVIRYLKVAISFLPKDYKIRLIEGWRDLDLQNKLYALGKDKEPPYKSNEKVARFCTGGCCIVELLDEECNLIDLIKDPKEIRTAYFEDSSNEKIKMQRRILYNAMIKAGFVNDGLSYRKYEYGTRIWAKATGNYPMYGGIFNEI